MSKKKRPVFSIGPSGSGRASGPDPGSAGPLLSRPAENQSPRVRWERSGRKGRTVTVAEPLHLTKEDGQALLAELKKACGSGGAMKVTKDREGKPALALEIQGDHADAVTAALMARGYAAKRSGG